MNVLVSQVGDQPAPVATVASALFKAGAIDRVILLKTDRSKTHADRLVEFIKFHLKGLHVDAPIDSFLESDRKLEDAVATLNAIAEGHRVYLNTSSGLSYFWGRLSSLVRNPNIFPVFAEFNEVLPFPGGEPWKIEDLGLENLLSLHGIEATYDEMPGREPVVKNFQIKGGKYKADYAFEKKGRLHCLWKKIETKEQVRELIALKPTSGLAVNRTIITTQSHVYNRAKVNGLEAFFGPSAESLKKRWFNRSVEVSGTNPPLRKNFVPEVITKAGPGGQGGGLLVCLGNDPSSTLAAIYSHRPSQAWVLYDSGARYVCWLADNLRKRAKDLPVDRLTLVPVESAYNGQNILNTNPQLDFLTEENPVWGNVTPGTKAQSWAFGQLNGVRLCSIVNRDGTIRSLNSADQLKLKVEQVPPGVIGKVKGGSGAAPRLTDRDLEEYLEFYVRILNCITSLADSESGIFSLGKHLRQNRNRRGEKILFASRQGDTLCATVQTDGQKYRGPLHAPLSNDRKIQGDWLEDVVAGVCRAAGSSNLCVGMKWPQDPSNPNRAHRTEIDVVFPWQTTHVAISVKAYGLDDGKQEEEKCLEIAAMARECLGRYCLPVLVYFKPESQCTEEASLQALKKYNALVVGAYQLRDPNTFRELIEAAFAQLQTTRKERMAIRS